MKTKKKTQLEGIEKSLLNFSGEISLLELARTSSFLNACRWSSYDNWLIYFEQAKLNFRLKRHTEAEHYFKKAFYHAPASYKPAIARIRFKNLTWLNGAPYLDMNFLPETLECGRQAIELSKETDEIADTCTWLMPITGEIDILDGVFDSHQFLQQGIAFDQIGERASAIKSWRKGLSEDYYNHRMHCKWINFFHFCQFNETFFFLVHNAIKNSWNIFLGLLELGESLYKILNTINILSEKYTRINETLKQITNRLKELGHDKFQDLIRLCNFFYLIDKKQDVREILSRAARLAESPEEYIELAIAKRKTGGISSGEPIKEEIRFLLKAEKESHNRILRLLIAREFSNHGLLLRAESILHEVEVSNPGKNFLPIEYILILQSYLNLKMHEKNEEKFKNLISDIKDNIRYYKLTGFIKYYLYRFELRIKETIESKDKTLYKRFFEDTPKSGLLENDKQLNQKKEKDVKSQKPSIWQKWKSRFIEVKDFDTSEDMLEYIDEIYSEFMELDFDTKIVLWELVYITMVDNLKKSESIRPDIKPDESSIFAKGLTKQEIPICKSDMIYNWRAQDLSDIWKKFIYSNNDNERNEYLRKIRVFYNSEEKLLARWEELRKKKMLPLLKKALFMAYCGKMILESLITNKEIKKLWPVFWDIESCLATDMNVLIKSVEQRIDQLKQQLLMKTTV